MRRVLSVLLAGAVTLALAWALASLPGRVSAEIGEFSFEAPTPVVALGLLLLFALLYAAFRLLGALARLPRTVRERRAVRRRHFGEAALTRTLLALAAGETGDARREASRARRLLGDTPTTLLLAGRPDRGRDDGPRPRSAPWPTVAMPRFSARGLLRQAIARG
jgi:HemY protein